MLSLELALPAIRFDFGQMRRALDAISAAAEDTCDAQLQLRHASGEGFQGAAGAACADGGADGAGVGAGSEGTCLGSVQVEIPLTAASPTGTGTAVATRPAAPSSPASNGAATDGNVPPPQPATAADAPPAPPPRALFALLPLGTMLLATPLGMWLDGRSKADGPSLIDAFAAADSTAALTWATGLGNLLAFALPLCGRQPLGSLIESWVRQGG